MLVIIWLVVALAALFGEVFTLSLVLASFSAAALLTAPLAFFLTIPFQLLVFGALSAVLLFGVRPVALRLLPLGSSGGETPRIGPSESRALVVDRVTEHGGQVRIGTGEFWTARLASPGTAIPAGREVDVIGTQGLTVLVRPAGLTEANAGDDEGPVPFGLSAREVEVLNLIAQGMSNGEIASTLFLSPRTVHHHVSHILTKMDAGSRTEAVRLGLEHGIVRLNGSSSRS